MDAHAQVESATQSYHMLVDEAWGQKSGECAAASMDRECTDPAKRKKLWADLAAMTGAAYPDK